MSIDNFIPKIWSARLLEHLDNNHVYGNIVNRDYEGEIASAGDTVNINQIGDVTISNYTKNTDINSPETLSDAQKTLIIDQQKYFNFQVDDVDRAQQKPKIMDRAMQRAAFGMNSVIDGYIASLYTNVDTNNKIGDDTTPKTPNSTTAYDFLVDLSVKLDEASVPEQGRYCVVPAWYHGLLRKDDRFVHATEMGDNVLTTGTLTGRKATNGLIGEVAGMSVYKSNNVPNTSGAKYKIIAGYSGAITFAEQIVEVEAYRPEKRFADAVKGLHVFGAKVTHPTGIAVLTADRS